MSRLESFIRRMTAQKDCLDYAISIIEDENGIVLELGLGNGRTYDHLRKNLPKHDIYAFDRQIGAHPSCIPEDQFLIMGNIFETLPIFVQSYPAKACLIHTDIGTGDAENNKQIAAFLSPHLTNLLTPNGLILSDQELHDLNRLETPDSVPKDRYFMYQKLQN